MSDGPVRAALRAWRDGLVNLDGSNRLLNFRPADNGLLEIAGPGPAEIVRALQQGGEHSFLPFGARADADGLFRTDLPGPELGPLLRRLARRARQDFLDRGVNVLHLAVGMLRWRDEEDAGFLSPILLLPVELTALGPGDTPKLRARDDDPVVNPALALRLRRMGVDLPAAEAWPELDPAAFRERVRAAVAGRDWHADDSVLLSGFSFHKEAMYRDLLDNEERILTHPVVRALAGKEQNAFGFPPANQADDEDLPLLLDADASQRACVAAAVQGRSFVLDGPPGTGKSQTIANMIGCLLAAGKQVLFVSEKAAALEVVRNRLAEAGLDGYLLELHSHKATRKEVARALAAALDDPAPPAGGPAVDRRLLRERREQLTGYATAVNEVREPFGSTLHDVLGTCAELAAVPAAPVPDVAPAALTPAAMQRIRAAADRAVRAWRPAAEGDAFRWRAVTEPEPLDGRLEKAQHALRALAAAAGRHDAAAAAFGLCRPADAPALAVLAGHAAGRPAGVRDDWLTAPSLMPVTRAAEQVRRERADLDQARDAAEEAAGADWPELPGTADLPAVEVPAGLVPPALDLGPLTADAAGTLARRFAEDATELEGHLRGVGRVAARLGLPAATTFADLSRVTAIAELGARPHRPEPFWFSAGVLPTVTTAAATLRRAAEAVAAAEVQCRRYFAEAIVDQPVEQLADRFANVHRGWRKLFGGYRRDWETVASFASASMSPAEAVAHLSTAVAWRQALREQAAAEQRFAPVLGRFWRRADTDFEAVHEAVLTAGEVLRLTPPEALPAVVEHVCRPTPDSGLIRPAADARAAVERLRAERPDVVEGLIAETAGWLRAHVAPLTAAAELIKAVQRVAGRELDLAGAQRLVRLRQAVTDADAALAAAHREDFGDTEAVDWAAAARRLATGADRPLTAEQAAALAGGVPAGDLGERAAAWQRCRAEVIQAFGAERHEEIGAALDDYDAAAALLRDWRDDADGQREWFDHRAARQALAEFGLDAALDFCADRQVAADQVRPVIERAVLRGWADAVIRTDVRLHPSHAAERDHLVEEFRRLDAALTAEAPGRIVEAVHRRRAAALTADETGLLRREGMKETRHLAVRDLVARARDAVLAVKPCFLMSPLAVSQFLPPDIRFDVVIFDEASQITPADAVNCIYRGTALIAAGDDRQLPPTSFFDRIAGPEQADDDGDATTDVNDFQSVLELAKACGAFRSLALTWHYRSRHEALIAFANHAFYQGRLITFPDADPGGPDAGVELIPARGVYRRGTSRDNPIEADLVAERIVASLTTRPERSLGVVTFSVAQADAITAALERAAAEHPGLARLLDGDRLSGFFVKSLESVQGDERDVMIFSIGYGFDELGKISTNFGALSQPNGWRRLNVAITRARQRVEIVSSIRAKDIPESSNESVRHLAAYLDFAERGMAALPARPGAGAAAGPFERSVLETVRSWGYDAREAIGSAGYRVDIGVRRPGVPSYALGIECDGPRYAATPVARDRDRLHAAVLGGLGWRLHRVWSTAWYRDRADEEARLRAAIERAVAESGVPEPPPAGPQPYRRVDLRLQPA
jgi:hypothetical protein